MLVMTLEPIDAAVALQRDANVLQQAHHGGSTQKPGAAESVALCFGVDTDHPHLWQCTMHTMHHHACCARFTELYVTCI